MITTNVPRPRFLVEMRPAETADARRLLSLRNDPLIVSLSRSGRPVTWEEHEQWFAQVLAAPERHRIYFLTQERKTVGVLRFDRASEDSAEITIYLLKSATGRGLGTEIIRRGCAMITRDWRITKVLAHIIRGNEASMRAFAKAGFEPASAEDAAAGWSMVLVMPPK